MSGPLGRHKKHGVHKMRRRHGHSSAFRWESSNCELKSGTRDSRATDLTKGSVLWQVANEEMAGPIPS